LKSQNIERKEQKHIIAQTNTVVPRFLKVQTRRKKRQMISLKMDFEITRKIRFTGTNNTQPVGKKNPGD
jgi:hypothetical protein